VEFPYVKNEGSQGATYRPCLPITFSNGEKKFRVGNALVDTGADYTILPLEIAHVLEVELDDSKTIMMSAAGGGRFKVMPSRRKIGYSIEKTGYRSINWKGTVWFAEGEEVVLLGHHDCLEKFDLTFRGGSRALSVLPLFKV
jgi:hypothetical protein